MQATCLVAKETEPPDGDKPVEWRLLTNLEVTNLEQAARMIDWYRARWEIEMFFHVLKNGCRIEALQLREIGVRFQFFRYRPCRQLVKISIEIPDCVFLQRSHTMAALTSMLHIRVGDGGTDDDGFVGV